MRKGTHVSHLVYVGFAPRARVLRAADPVLYRWLQKKFHEIVVRAQKLRRARRRVEQVS
jgi:hypothetical protein